MSLFFDDFGLRPWVMVAAITMGFGLLLGLGAVGFVHSDHVDCLRLHEATGKPTTIKASGLTRECYIKVDEDWIPADRYRGVDVDGGS